MNSIKKQLKKVCLAMKNFQTNAANLHQLSSIFNNPSYLCSTKNRSFSGKKCPNFYALYNDRDKT